MLKNDRPIQAFQFASVSENGSRLRIQNRYDQEQVMIRREDLHLTRGQGLSTSVIMLFHKRVFTLYPAGMSTGICGSLTALTLDSRHLPIAIIMYGYSPFLKTTTVGVMTYSRHESKYPCI